MNFTKEDIYNELFDSITRIGEDFMHEFMNCHSGDCVDRIQNEEAKAVSEAYKEFAKSHNTTVAKVKQFMKKIQKPLQPVMDQLSEEFKSIARGYEEDCGFSFEFTPKPSYESILEIIESNGAELEEFHIFFPDNQEWASFASLIEYEKHLQSQN